MQLVEDAYYGKVRRNDWVPDVAESVWGVWLLAIETFLRGWSCGPYWGSTGPKLFQTRQMLGADGRNSHYIEIFASRRQGVLAKTIRSV